MKNIILFVSILLPYLVSAQNVKIMEFGNPTELSIILDPKNPNILVAGSNLNYYYTSSDGGVTWESMEMTSPYGIWGDPAIEVDTSGNFYFFHISSPPEGEGEHID